MAFDSEVEFPVKYLRPSEVADILRVKPQTLANWRYLGKGPEWRRLGGIVVYPREGVLLFCGE